jgi:hypothetical protein
LSGSVDDTAARGPSKAIASNGRGLYPNEATEPSEKIWHDAIRKNPHRIPLTCQPNQLDKRIEYLDLCLPRLMT